MRRRFAESLAVLLSIASLGAGAPSGPSSLEAAKITPPLKIATGGRPSKNSSTPKSKAYEIGTASWYGEQFQGRQTTSGEPFDMRDFTAAHPSIPLGTFVRVTNLKNGRGVVVRINDRGPFVDDRIIDLSRNAARALGFEERGVQRVRLDIYPTANSRSSKSFPRPSGPPVATLAELQPVAKLK